ncbi:hypothetical protein QFC22_003890 [Naganishia vaughanmartiniae]|uniref:Uncharacterized protein n=1 Tax=Naganishia vaughanmartiniae TaxID=1424756 RepID=A0ACC2X503_9TREE|nr:hypothetical protein QFC22_003890 [Naganishia vaughanmartiniae]
MASPISRTMFIQTESTPNDNSLKFIPGVPVMVNGGTYEILDAKSSLVSPLAVRLMGVEGVTGVFYGPDFVTVSKDDSQPWNLLKAEIFAILMEHFTAGKPLFRENHAEADGPQDTKILDTDSEVVAMIKELLDTRVRPAIQEDGGDIEYKGFDEDTGVVKLKLKGSCRGCSSSSVTLKSGIERMLTHYIPEVQTVEQVLDEEELISLDEFAKLEKRLEAKNQDKKDGMSQYMSV